MCRFFGIFVFAFNMLMFTDASVAQEKYPPSAKWLSDNENKKDSKTVAIRCPSRDKCIKPGACTRSELNNWQNRKNDLCNKTRSCDNIKVVAPANKKDIKPSEKVDCQELYRRIERGQECRDQRTKIMSSCFYGGDAAHIKERKATQDVLDSCMNKLKSAKSMGICK